MPSIFFPPKAPRDRINLAFDFSARLRAASAGAACGAENIVDAFVTATPDDLTIESVTVDAAVVQFWAGGGTAQSAYTLRAQINTDRVASEMPTHIGEATLFVGADGLAWPPVVWPASSQNGLDLRQPSNLINALLLL